nr:MAG TPA: hypothetical protein [Caudoviricetes sp.]
MKVEMIGKKMTMKKRMKITKMKMIKSDFYFFF